MIWSLGTMIKHITPDTEAFSVLDEGQVRDLQRVLAMMLDDMLKLCERHNTPFFLGGGSCLGAVRHHGFIPWDDDVDINMFRADLPRFVEAVREEFPDKYVVQTPWETHNYGVGVIHVRLKETVVRGHSDYADMAGACIDVFAIENVPENLIVRTHHGFWSLVFGFVASCKRIYDHRDAYRMLSHGDLTARRVFNTRIALGRLFSFRSLDAWTHAWDRWNSRCHNDASKYVTGPAGRHHYFGEMHRRDCYVPYTQGEFEGMRVNLPANCDEYLTSCYGPDYMTPPPEDERERHVVFEFDLGEYAQSDGEAAS